MSKNICVNYFVSICTRVNCTYAHELLRCQHFPNCSYKNECKFVHLTDEFYEQLRTCCANRPYPQEIAHELGRLSKILLSKVKPRERKRFCRRQLLGNYCPEESDCDECNRNHTEALLKSNLYHLCTNPRCEAIINDNNLRLAYCYHLYCKVCFELLPERFDEAASSNARFCLVCDAEIIKNLCPAWNMEQTKELRKKEPPLVYNHNLFRKFQMVSFSFKVLPQVPLCPKAPEKFWCGEVRCHYSHNFIVCHDFQNNLECHRRGCISMHISIAEQQRHAENGIMSGVLIKECIRTRQVRGMCRIENCEEGKNCLYNHTLAIPEQALLECPICQDVIKKMELVVTKACYHGICKKCYQDLVRHQELSYDNTIRCPKCRTESEGVFFYPEEPDAR